MLIPEYLQAFDEHAPAVAAAAEAVGLDAEVPTCPGWAVRDLVGHIGGVHRWAATILRAGPDGDAVRKPPPPVDGLLEWYRAGVAQLADVLTTSPDDLAAWTFWPAPSPRAFWARRQAHETAMHRADAESARARSIDVPVPFAVDGIDELVNCFLARPRGKLLTDPPASVLIAPTDDDRWWHMTINPDGRVVRSAGSRHASLTLRGTASDLYLFVWNRVPAGPVEVQGDPRVLQLWRERATI